MPSPNENQIADLLIHWEDRLELGEVLSAEELCRDCPDLTEAVAQQIRNLQAMESLLGTDIVDEASTLAPDSSGYRRGDRGIPEAVYTETAYQVGRMHARGGKGQVYIAHDSILDRKVAIKCLHPSTTPRSTDHRRLVREATITSQLQHPGVVSVFGLGQDSEIYAGSGRSAVPTRAPVCRI